MELLKNRIRQDGTKIGTEIVKVDSFLNHQIDIKLINEIGKEFAGRFKNDDITKILTIEASGIAIACITSMYFNNIPVIFAKKTFASNMEGDFYCAKVRSFTKGTISTIRVAKNFIHPNDNVLILDDFLAHGEAATGLAEIVRQAKANVVGVAIVIEKQFQGGGKKLRDQGLRLESLAVIREIKDGQILFE